MLTRTRSKTLSTTAMPAADSTSEDDFLSSQSQSQSTPPSSSLDSNPTMADLDDHFDNTDPANDTLLPDTITQQAATATVHIHCPTTVTQAADAIDLTDEPPAAVVGEGTVGWEESGVSVSVMHVLPCEIHYNGPAAVTQYFQPTRVINPLLAAAASSSSSVARSPTTYISTETPSTDASWVSATGSGGGDGTADAALAESRWYTAAFRGRQLTGEKVALPAHTIGLVIKDSKQHKQQQQRHNTSSKRHRPARPHASRSAAASAAEDECAVVEDMTAVEGEGEAGVRVDWLVDGWFTDVTLWGRDTDWKGVDQSILKRSLLDWPVIAAALHYVPPVELPTGRIEFS